MKLHPAAWMAWLTAVTVFAFTISNPLYLILGFAAVMVVHLSFPADPSPVGRAVRTFLILGGVVLVARLVFVAFITNPGETVLFTLPTLRLPRWLGGIGVGGAISAEVLVANATDGLRIITVLAAFGVFNARADVSSLVRAVPPVLRDVGLVVGIAIGFVPGMLATMADVRDAQRMRGEHGLRRFSPSLVVPILGSSLERAMLLAESMDIRGYRQTQTGPEARRWMGIGVIPLVLATIAWVAGSATAATGLAILGIVALAWGLRAASRASRVTRLAIYRVRPFDIAVLVSAGAAVILAMAAGPTATFDPYPALQMPAVSTPVAAIALLLSVPSIAGAESR